MESQNVVYPNFSEESEEEKQNVQVPCINPTIEYEQVNNILVGYDVDTDTEKTSSDTYDDW